MDWSKGAAVRVSRQQLILQPVLGGGRTGSLCPDFQPAQMHQNRLTLCFLRVHMRVDSWTAKHGKVMSSPSSCMVLVYVVGLRRGGQGDKRAVLVPGGSGDISVLRGSPGGTEQRFKMGTLHSIMKVVQASEWLVWISRIYQTQDFDLWCPDILPGGLLQASISVHLLGLMTATRLVVPYAHLRMRLVQWFLKS